MTFSELISKQALQTRIHNTILLLDNGVRHIQERPAGDARADKAACEIALLIWGLNRNGYFATESNAAIQNLLNVSEQRLRSEAVIQGLLWKPSRASILCMGTALLNGLGRPDPKFDKLAQVAWQRLFIDSSERSPFQLLEVEWSSQLLWAEGSINALENSLLLRKSSPLMMNAEDGYAFTHSVFYVTDFGRHQLPTKINAKNIWETIESGLIWCILRFDFDLLGEFLLTALYCQMPCTPMVYICLSALFLTWDENGFVPDRELSASDLTSGGIFYGIYHANIVAALLASELMNRKVDYDPGAASSHVSISPSIDILSAEQLSKLSIFRFDAVNGKHYKFMSTTAILTNILGRSVTEKVILILSDVTLVQMYLDLLIGYGLIYQDIEAVWLGVRGSIDNELISPAVDCGVQWLIMAAGVFEVLRDIGHEHIAHEVNIA